MRKCDYCDKEELCGVGKGNIPVCEKHLDDYLKGKQLEAELRGRQTVVDWLINDSYDTTIHFGEDWQAKLKEWGIKK